MTLQLRARQIYRSNRREVEQYVNRREIRFLFRSSGFMRKVMQQSIRRRKGTSPPGGPPYAHGRSPLRRLIAFSVNRKARTATIGPQIFNGRRRNPMRRVKNKDPAPRTLERGGSITINGRRSKIRARPFVDPAWAKTRRRWQTFWN